jgi:hypothetical protein
MPVDVDALTRRWRQSWPQCPPTGHLFRSHLPDRWVRFHTLPAGRRYASTKEQDAMVLDRYNAVLGALDASLVYLITVAYGAGDVAGGTEPIHVGLHPGAVRWMNNVYVSLQGFTSGDLDPLLHYVANDRARDVVIADADLQWLYHPYDGGMDVILPSIVQRDLLGARFSQWLSARPDGL